MMPNSPISVQPQDTAILVASCDRYADVWDPFFSLFRSRWRDCPYPLYLGTNFKTYEQHDVTTIAIGEDVSWADGVREMLGRIRASHVIFLLEDFFLTQRVDTARICEMVGIAKQEQLGCLRLVGELPLAYRPTEEIEGYDGLGEIRKGSLYRVSAQAAIWRVDTLLKLLIPGASAWEFEELGTRLSDSLSERFWGVLSDALHYKQVVEKGRWKPEGLQLCEEAGIAIDSSRREIYSHESLAAHFEDSGIGAEEAGRRRSALKAFSLGRRFEGIQHALSAIRLHPASLRIWAILICGLVGPRPIRWLEAKHLDRQIARIRGRVE